MKSWVPDEKTYRQMRAYFASGAKGKSALHVGVEWECIFLMRDGLKPLPYSGAISITTILQQLHQLFGWQPVYEASQLVALQRGASRITLEPAGQVELSSEPHQTIAALHREISALQQELSQLDIYQEIMPISGGMNPLHTPDQLHWVPKERYNIMRTILPKRSKLGLYMMGLTSATQVSLDYKDEQDCQRKFRTACGLVPLFVALYANSPLYSQKKTGYQSYRSHVWTQTDPGRCGVPAFVFAAEPFFDAYIDYALDVPMLFRRKHATAEEVLVPEERTYRQWQRDSVATWELDDWLLHLSTIFTEVRLKNFIEIRSVDTNRLDIALSFPALCKAIFYNDDALDEAWKLVANLNYEQRLDAMRSAAAGGLAAGKAHRYSLLELSKELVEIARHSLAEIDRQQGSADSPYLEPLADQVFSKGVSPAEELLRLWEGRWRYDVKLLIEFLSSPSPRGSLPKPPDNIS